MGTKSYHILLGDDDDDDANLFREAISELPGKFAFYHVKDGEEVLQFLEEKMVDLLFLDLNMPNLNGIDCLKQIRANRFLHQLPVIIYSTSNNMVYIENCFREGASRYIVKPYSYSGIVRLLNGVMKSDFINYNHPMDINQFVLQEVK